MTYALIIHGGAGAQPDFDYTEQRKHLNELILAGQKLLEAGTSAVDVVDQMVSNLEASGLYVAGKGSAPNTAGIVELDASIMDGKSRAAGAVAATPNLVHPIKAARAVMDDGQHVMMSGDGAKNFALASGLEAVSNPDAYYSEHEKHGSGGGEESGSHGTVGAVAMDLEGNLAAGTSTGGTFNKRPGRVGDTPLIGAGTWADDTVAVSCTGVGEMFIQAAAAYDVSARMRYARTSLDLASRQTLDEVKKLDGDGGLIAIDHAGNITMPYNSLGMKRAFVSNTAKATVRIFEREDL
jgi:isoaspartyl peptidase/L-asparaginase-like protein (Ntn-hydrolase superfamily)